MRLHITWGDVQFSVPPARPPGSSENRVDLAAKTVGKPYRRRLRGAQLRRIDTPASGCFRTSDGATPSSISPAASRGDREDETCTDFAGHNDGSGQFGWLLLLSRAARLF